MAQFDIEFDGDEECAFAGGAPHFEIPQKNVPPSEELAAALAALVEAHLRGRVVWG